MQSGSGRCLYELLSQLKDEDEIKPVVLLHNNNSFLKKLKEMGVEAYYCRFGYTSSACQSKWMFLFWKYIYRNIANLWAYIFLLIKIDLKTLDLIYSNSMIIDFGAFLHRRTGLPHVWHVREFGKKDFGLKPFFRCLPKYMEKNAGKILSVSKAVRQEYLKNGGDPNKIQCIYDGVVGSDYAKCKRKKHDVDLLKIVMVGRLSEEKGQFFAIEAIRNLPKECSQHVQLDFYGAGKDEIYLKRLVQQYRLSERIRFFGFSSNIKDVLTNYDVGLVLSKSEGFGRITVEYLLSGLHVIGTNTGATPEILDGGKYGFLVPYGNVNALTKIIENMAENRSYFCKCTDDGLNYARQNFCIEKYYKKIIDVFRSFCQ